MPNTVLAIMAQYTHLAAKTRSSGILRTCPNRMGAAAYSRIPTITAMARWSTTLILNTIFCFSGSPSPSA